MEQLLITGVLFLIGTKPFAWLCDKFIDEPEDE